jgi:predicted DNA-binding transcriptional regulator AlpA
MSLEHSPARAGLRILRLKHVCARYSISASTVWQWTKERRLPQPVELGPNTVGWFEHELDERDLALARARELILSVSAAARPHPRRAARRAEDHGLGVAKLRHPSRGFEVLAPSRPGTFCQARTRLQRL